MVGPLRRFCSNTRRLRIPAAVGRLWLAPFLLLAVLWTHERCVEARNFYGYDEWTVLTLLSQGVMDIPYANRPLALLWALPAPLLQAHSFAPFVTMRWAYLWLTAMLVMWISLRIAPGRPMLAFLAASFVLVWAPTDNARLSLVEGGLYAGITFGMTLSASLYVESWVRQSAPLLALASLLALVSGRCYEPTLAVLLLSPLLLLLAGARASRALGQWVLAYEAFVVLGLVQAMTPILFESDAPSYQASYRLDASPLAILERVRQQFWLHFGPLVSPRLEEIQAHASAVAITLAIFLCAAAAWQRAAEPGAAGKPSLRLLLAAGVLLTAAGYAAVLVTGSTPSAWRAQFLSAPGAAWLLSGLIGAAGARLGRHGGLLVLVLSAWVVAVGTARVSAMQQGWKAQSFYSRQMRLLSSLVAAAPDTRPGSLVLLIDQDRTWRASFTFHHAVEYLYGGHARGQVAGAPPAMFPAYFTPGGVFSEPFSSVRAAWGTRSTLFRYDEIVVVRDAQGALAILEVWPPELPPLPPGARYAPRDRVRSLIEPLPQRRALVSLDGR